MITFPCLSTTHSSCSAESTCECHCHSMARLPPVELDYTLSKSDTISIPSDDTTFLPPDIALEVQQREDLEMIDYHSDLEFESAYVQGEDLTYFGYQILEGIDEPVRPPTKHELEEEARAKQMEENRKKLVAQAKVPETRKTDVVPTAKQLTFDSFFG